MTHKEAMERRWFQCWYYPCQHHKSSHFKADKEEWNAKWAKDIRKEARAYLKAFSTLTPTQRKILWVSSVLAEQAKAFLEEDV